MAKNRIFSPIREVREDQGGTVSTIEDIYAKITSADLDSFMVDLEAFLNEYAKNHALHVGYAKLFFMDDDDRRVCDATYTAHID